MNENIISFELKKLIREVPLGVFRPVAYYNPNLDMIFVQIEDCSYVEEWQNHFFSLLFKNHSEKKECIVSQLA